MSYTFTKVIQSIIISITILAFIGCNQKQAPKTTPQVKTQKQTDLTNLGMAQSENNILGGLNVGDVAPEFSGIDQDGHAFSLTEQLNNGPVVMIFYRGYWCPICTRHLEGLEKDLYKIIDKGAQVVAITPETNEYVEKTVDKSKTSIKVLSDKDKQIMEDYRVKFEVTEAYQEKINTKLDADIATTNGDEDAYLPVPATYIIGTNGKIVWRHYDPNYRERASIQDILAAL